MKSPLAITRRHQPLGYRCHFRPADSTKGTPRQALERCLEQCRKEIDTSVIQRVEKERGNLSQPLILEIDIMVCRGMKQPFSVMLRTAHLSPTPPILEKCSQGFIVIESPPILLPTGHQTARPLHECLAGITTDVTRILKAAQFDQLATAYTEKDRKPLHIFRYYNIKSPKKTAAPPPSPEPLKPILPRPEPAKPRKKSPAVLCLEHWIAFAEATQGNFYEDAIGIEYTRKFLRDLKHHLPALMAEPEERVSVTTLSTLLFRGLKSSLAVYRKRNGKPHWRTAMTYLLYFSTLVHQIIDHSGELSPMERAKMLQVETFFEILDPPAGGVLDSDFVDLQGRLDDLARILKPYQKN